MWPVICLVVASMTLVAYGNPIASKAEISEIIIEPKVKPVKITKREYLCNYFSNPTLDEYAFLSLSPTGFLINLRVLRERCNTGRYFKGSSQRYSTWDLSRK